MGLFVSILAGILPMLLFAWVLYSLDRYEKEPIFLLAIVYCWGAVIAAGGAFIFNSFSSLGIYLITQSEFATQLTISTLVAPLVEETLKGTAVFLIFLIYKNEFDSPLDGLVYGGITALGFAATENIWYIYQLGFLENGWQGLLDLALIRVLLVGWQHPFYTAFIGLGFALSRRSKDLFWKWLSPIIGWTTAVLFHLLHNLFSILLSNTQGRAFSIIWDWSGYLSLFLLILILINREQYWMRVHLSNEVDDHILSLEQYLVACSAWKQGLSRFRARLEGNPKQIRELYQACGDLMHKKRQLIRSSGDPAVLIEIERLRTKICDLSKAI